MYLYIAFVEYIHSWKYRYLKKKIHIFIMID